VVEGVSGEVDASVVEGSGVETVASGVVEGVSGEVDASVVEGSGVDSVASGVVEGVSGEVDASVVVDTVTTEVVDGDSEALVVVVLVVLVVEVLGCTFSPRSSNAFEISIRFSATLSNMSSEVALISVELKIMFCEKIKHLSIM
jgi:hypothetical protein